MNQIVMDWIIPDGEITAGVDEVGRGPLCGAVVTAAVILDPLNPIGPRRDVEARLRGVARGILRDLGGVERARAEIEPDVDMDLRLPGSNRHPGFGVDSYRLHSTPRS